MPPKLLSATNTAGTARKQRPVAKRVGVSRTLSPVTAAGGPGDSDLELGHVPRQRRGRPSPPAPPVPAPNRSGRFPPPLPHTHRAAWPPSSHRPPRGFPSAPGAPQNATAVPPKWGSGRCPPWCHSSEPRAPPHPTVPWGTSWTPRTWVIVGSSSPSPQILHPYRLGAPGPRVTSTPGGGHPAGDTRDSKHRASLRAVSDPYPTLPGGQKKTPRRHGGSRQELPHLTPGRGFVATAARPRRPPPAILIRSLHRD